MNRSIKLLAVLLAIMIVSTAAFGTGVFVGEMGLVSAVTFGRSTDRPAEFDVFWQAWDIVQRNFVDRDALDPKQLTYGAIRGMVQALGDEGHTAFLTPEERERQQTNLSGTFSGIGAQLGIRDSLPVIIAPFDGSPAQEAGVEAGDIIIRVDGEDVTTMSLNDIVMMIRGPEGTDVVLSLLRPAQNETLEVTITRGEIKIPAATWAMVPGSDVALVRLSQFSANATDDIVASIDSARAAGARGLLVDVRNNPGGLLEQAIGVTSQFLSDGDVLLEEDAEGNRRAYEVKSGGAATDIPLVVLINQGSASSAEILAGAIQDHDRGTLVGETTFGTGTVLQPYILQDDSALLLGTKQWLTPSGRLIRKHGIEPDVVVDMDIGTELMTPMGLDGATPDDVAATEDRQFLEALDLLRAEL